MDSNDVAAAAWHLVVSELVQDGGDVRALRAASSFLCHHVDSVLAELLGQHRALLLESRTLLHHRTPIVSIDRPWHRATLALAVRALYESDVYPGGTGCATLSLPRAFMDDPSARFWMLHDFYVRPALYDAEAARGPAAMVALSYPFLAMLHVLRRGRLLTQILSDWQQAHGMRMRVIVGLLGLLLRVGDFPWTVTDAAHYSVPSIDGGDPYESCRRVMGHRLTVRDFLERERRACPLTREDNKEEEEKEEEEEEREVYGWRCQEEDEEEDEENDAAEAEAAYF